MTIWVCYHCIMRDSHGLAVHCYIFLHCHYCAAYCLPFAFYHTADFCPFIILRYDNGRAAKAQTSTGKIKGFVFVHGRYIFGNKVSEIDSGPHHHVQVLAVLSLVFEKLFGYRVTEVSSVNHAVIERRLSHRLRSKLPDNLPLLRRHILNFVRCVLLAALRHIPQLKVIILARFITKDTLIRQKSKDVEYVDVIAFNAIVSYATAGHILHIVIEPCNIFIIKCGEYFCSVMIHCIIFPNMVFLSAIFGSYNLSV